MRIILLPLTLLALIGCTGEKPNFPTTTGPTAETDDDTGLDDSQLDGDGDGYAADVDCDDTDADIHPDAAELCDSIDNDCDDEIDEDAADASAWYPDTDEDSYGSAEDEPVTACDQPTGYTDNADDCDDYDDAVNPDGVEVCDGLDNDCDLLTDSLDPDIKLDTVTTWYADSDEDGYGNITDTTDACDQPSGYVLDDTDCDDSAEDVNPGEDELCDDRDNDCDEEVDEDAVDAATHYADTDGDSYGDPAAATTTCKLPSGYTDNPSDCDDTDAAISPDAAEICDSIDNDCDGDIDDADSSVDTSVGGATFFADADSDTFGDSTDSIEACAAPTGYTARAGDCDDTDSTIRPSAAEICDDVDNDCDGDIDDDDDDVDTSAGGTFYADGDGDGYGDADDTTRSCDEPSGYVSDASDCDDSDGNVNEAADETCDGIDNDCDGDTDDYDSDVTDAETFYRDFDGDGFGTASYSASACTAPSSYVLDDTDCDDSDAAVNEDAPEDCDGADNNCDGDIDDDDDSIDASTQGTWYADGDGDGYGDTDDSTVTCERPSGYAEQGGDCDDDAGGINPGSDEICNDVDDDCNGDIDDDDAGVDTSGGGTFYADVDGDGYGDSTDTTDACDEPSGYVTDDSDCDDTDGNVNEAADETCDGIDNDCDSLIDDDDGDIDLSTATTFYTDADGDGYGDGSDSTVTCAQPTGTVTDASDCDDSDGSVNEAADETCDGIDNDCDGDIDDNDDDVDTTTGDTFYADVDGDGYGDLSDATDACDQPSGTVSDSTDCDDTDGAISPAADEICDDVDNDCDSDIDDDDSSLDTATADSFYADTDGDGYGDSGDALVRCDEPSGYVSDATDCDDTDGDISPAAEEVCDELDNDCDGTTDTDATDISTWYGDADDDGYGGSTFSKQSCDQPSGYVDNSDDCDDLDASLSPAAEDVCDEIDNDCDGTVDNGEEGEEAWYADDDMDGYGDPDDEVLSCAEPSGYTDNADDCDDSDDSTYAGAEELCDSIDNDCNEVIDDGTAIGSDASCAAYSCLEIIEEYTGAADGTYYIDPDDDGIETEVYCDMTTDGGGWTMIVDDDYTTDSCPGSWVKDTTQQVCRRDTAGGSAVAASFDAHGLTYEEVAGELIAYQYASANAYWYASSRTIEDIYVDGISITVGASGSREHVFTYAIGMTMSTGYAYDCPAIGGNSPPSFVGSDYLCGSGNSTASWGYTWYSSAIFSGDSFQADIASGSTTDDVEVRLMCDEEASSYTYSEDVGVRSMTLYVR